MKRPSIRTPRAYKVSFPLGARNTETCMGVIGAHEKSEGIDVSLAGPPREESENKGRKTAHARDNS